LFSGVSPSGDRFLKHDNSHGENLGRKSKLYFFRFVNGSAEGLAPPDHLPFNLFFNLEYWQFFKILGWLMIKAIAPENMQSAKFYYRRKNSFSCSRFVHVVIFDFGILLALKFVFTSQQWLKYIARSLCNWNDHPVKKMPSNIILRILLEIQISFGFF